MGQKSSSLRNVGMRHINRCVLQCKDKIYKSQFKLAVLTNVTLVPKGPSITQLEKQQRVTNRLNPDSATINDAWVMPEVDTFDNSQDRWSQPVTGYRWKPPESIPETGCCWIKPYLSRAGGRPTAVQGGLCQCLQFLALRLPTYMRGYSLVYSITHHPTGPFYPIS